jgi:hypothetical protein
MRDSVVGGNANVGVLANATQVFFTVEESSIVANLTAGIRTNSAGAVVNVGASTIGGNGTGVLPTQGSLISFGNNQTSANGSSGNFTDVTPCDRRYQADRSGAQGALLLARGHLRGRPRTGNIGIVSVTGSGAVAVTVHAASAATIVLRHLSLNGNRSAATGFFTNAFASGTLVVEDCTIQGFTNDGIVVALSSPPLSPDTSMSEIRRRMKFICKSSHLRPCSLSIPTFFSLPA